MKKILYVLIVALIICSSITAQQRRVKRQGVTPTTVGAKPKNEFTYNYSIAQFKGKWQEVKRTYKNGNLASITDTIFIFFKGDDKVETRDGNKTYIKGEGMLEAPGNILVAAADIYTILSATNDSLVLDDQDEFIHTLVKVNQFWIETVGKTPVATEAYDQPVKPNIDQLKGNWNIYRRQAAPGTINSNTVLIKNLKITNKIDENSATGEVTFYNNEKSETATCTIVINGTAIQINAGTNKWTFPVYKADGKDLVFGNKGKLLYFAKPL
jgi:hypothetical protein